MLMSPLCNRDIPNNLEFILYTFSLTEFSIKRK